MSLDPSQAQSLRLLEHKLLGSLGGVVGYTELAMDSLPPDRSPDVQAYLENVLESVKRTQAYLEEIMRLALQEPN